MSKAKDRIRKAIEVKGYSVEEIVYVKPGIHYEMSGQEGGWEVYVEPPVPDFPIPRDVRGFIDGTMVTGWNVDDVLEVVALMPQAPGGQG